MTDASAVAATNTNWVQNASNNPIDFLKSLDDLLENFGPQEIGNAVTQQFMSRFVESLRDQINSSDLPQGLKDSANAVLDTFAGTMRETCPCSSEASEAVAGSSESDAINESAEATAEEVAESANEGTSTPAGGSAPAASPDAQAEANEEAQNEGTVTDDGTDAAVQNNQILEENGPGGSKRKAANWFEAIALALAEIQSKFLDKALAASEAMTLEADNAAGDGNDKSAKFLENQSLFTANMQLFNLFANQSATALKTLGEAMAGIARKQ